MSVILNFGGKKLQVVRNRADVPSPASAIKMKVDSIRSASQGVVSQGVRAMRALQSCSPNDTTHKSMSDAIQKAITHSAVAGHDAGYYNDSSAAHSVASSAAAAKSYRAAMKSMSSMNCAKCADHMKSMKSALEYGIGTMEENAGIADDDVELNDPQTGTFKRIHVPNNSIAFGTATKKIGDRKYGGYLVSFTGPEKPDAEGEYFDKETDFMIGVFPIKAAMSLYDHGLDPSIGSCPIGTVSSAEVKDGGIYIETNLMFAENYKRYLHSLEAPEKWKTKQMALAEKYDKLIAQMLDDGRLGWSSGAHTPSVVKSKTGHIERWPIIEASATPIPAMPFETNIQPIKALLRDGADGLAALI